MRDHGESLDKLTPRVAVAALLMIDRVIEEYEIEKGLPVPPGDRQIICNVLRAIARRDCQAVTR